MINCPRCKYYTSVIGDGLFCVASERIQKDYANDPNRHKMAQWGKINGTFEENWSHPKERCEWGELNRVGKLLEEGLSINDLRIKQD